VDRRDPEAAVREVGVGILTVVSHPAALIPIGIVAYAAWDRWQIRRVVREIERNRRRRAEGCSSP
jgi:hypothetical protein